MALLEFLLRCFRRRSPDSDHKRPLCTQEDSAQDASTDNTQVITAQPVRSFAAVQASPRLSGQHDSPSGYVSMEDDSKFGFTKGAIAAQVWPVPVHNRSAAYAERLHMYPRTEHT